MSSNLVPLCAPLTECGVQPPFGVCVLVRALRTFPFSAAAATYLVTLVRPENRTPRTRAGCSVRACPVRTS